MKFNQLELSDFILDALEEQGFEEATEIQSLTIPAIKEGKDVLGLSHTGSGKTYAFGIPALECINTEEKSQQVLIICPTRELAGQVAEEIRKLTKNVEGYKIVPVVGGSSMDRQISGIKKNGRIIVGTPGRIMDHLRRKTLRLARVKMIVLDEADEMLNMGFREDIETILQASNPQHQTIMFSATMAKEILQISKEYMNEPEMIKSSSQDNPQEFIDQFFIKSQKDKKFDTLCDLYRGTKPKTSIIFCNTKRMTDQLTTMLCSRNFNAVCIHGDMRQGARKRTMEDFKAKGGILVATDVAARGIDVKNVDMVVNFDFPQNTDYYVHRIGRTARAGKDGMAVSIINTLQQLKEMELLMAQTKNTINEMAEYSNTETLEVEKSKKRGGRGGNRDGGKQNGKKRGASDGNDLPPKPSEAIKKGKMPKVVHPRFGGNLGRFSSFANEEDYASQPILLKHEEEEVKPTKEKNKGGKTGKPQKKSKFGKYQEKKPKHSEEFNASGEFLESEERKWKKGEKGGKKDYGKKEFKKQGNPKNKKDNKVSEGKKHEEKKEYGKKDFGKREFVKKESKKSYANSDFEGRGKRKLGGFQKSKNAGDAPPKRKGKK